MKKKIFISIALVLLFVFSWLASKLFASNSKYDWFNLYVEIVNMVEKDYARDVNVDELFKNSINGMLENLDPHSRYLDKEEYKLLSSDTKGEFGGLGIQIGIRDKWLTVISPIEGTPAERKGIMPGDRIVTIEGKTTAGITIEDAVKKLRGKPGTNVNIGIYREGYPDTININITRDIIKINAVPYAGIIDGNIGYIKLNEFSKPSFNEITKALKTLEQQGASKFIVDLRGNPGGLLYAAIQITSLFLKNGKAVVITKGKATPERIYSSYGYDIVGENVPMIFLVNRGSASASEILAGAVQDWEKALLIGETTYGKGSVQSIKPLSDGGVLKLTTAYWYTPCGRSIDKHSFYKTGDEEMKKKTFRTLGKFKNKLTAEGGITPDIIIRPENYSFTVGKMISKGVFFDYAVKYKKTHAEWDTTVNEKMINDVLKLAKQKGISISSCLLEENYDDLKERLEYELAYTMFGTKGRYLISFKEDTVVKTAIKLLKKVRKQEQLFNVSKDFKNK